MKINDVINGRHLDEAGIWQGVKNIGARMINPELRQASSAEKYKEKARQQVISGIIAEWSDWLNSLKRRGDMDMNDPATYQTQLENWAKQRLPSAFADGSPVPVKQVIPGDIKSVGNYLTSVYSKGVTAAAATSAPDKVTAEPAVPAPPASTSSVGLFNNPQNLAAAWEAYKEAGGKFTPALRKTIKDIWMNMGGIKAESKNYKK